VASAPLALASSTGSLRSPVSRRGLAPLRPAWGRPGAFGPLPGGFGLNLNFFFYFSLKTFFSNVRLWFKSNYEYGKNLKIDF
jgi:hypothetical protein